MQKLVAAIIIIVIGLAAVFFFVLRGNDDPQQDAVDTQTSTETASDLPQNTPIDEGNTEPTPGASEGATNEISIDNSAFSPTVARIKKGTTVTWTNNDSVQHTVTGSEGGPESPVLSPGETYSFTFNEPGTFDYICTLHAGMSGQVFVSE